MGTRIEIQRTCCLSWHFEWWWVPNSWFHTLNFHAFSILQIRASAFRADGFKRVEVTLLYSVEIQRIYVLEYRIRGSSFHGLRLHGSMFHRFMAHGFVSNIYVSSVQAFLVKNPVDLEYHLQVYFVSIFAVQGCWVQNLRVYGSALSVVGAGFMSARTIRSEFTDSVVICNEVRKLTSRWFVGVQ